MHSHQPDAGYKLPTACWQWVRTHVVSERSLCYKLRKIRAYFCG